MKMGETEKTAGETARKDSETSALKYPGGINGTLQTTF
jgi:hypothetical protein